MLINVSHIRLQGAVCYAVCLFWFYMILNNKFLFVFCVRLQGVGRYADFILVVYGCVSVFITFSHTWLQDVGCYTGLCTGSIWYCISYD